MNRKSRIMNIKKFPLTILTLKNKTFKQNIKSLQPKIQNTSKWTILKQFASPMKGATGQIKPFIEHKTPHQRQKCERVTNSYWSDLPFQVFDIQLMLNLNVKLSKTQVIVGKLTTCAIDEN